MSVEMRHESGDEPARERNATRCPSGIASLLTALGYLVVFIQEINAEADFAPAGTAPGFGHRRKAQEVKVSVPQSGPVGCRELCRRRPCRLHRASQGPGNAKWSGRSWLISHDSRPGCPRRKAASVRRRASRSVGCVVFPFPCLLGWRQWTGRGRGLKMVHFDHDELEAESCSTMSPALIKKPLSLSATLSCSRRKSHQAHARGSSPTLGSRNALKRQ
jgi:hypothetical protein